MSFSAITLVAIIYWLALAAWFGATLFIAVAAPVIFRTVRDADPTLPTVLSVNLEGQHSSLLAGQIVMNLLSALGRVEFVCAIALAVAQAGEWAVVVQGDRDIVLPILRTALLIAAVILAFYSGRVVRPRAEAARREYIDNADDPDVANPALERFDHYHRESVLVLVLVLFALAGLVFFAAIGLGVPGSIVLGE